MPSVIPQVPVGINGFGRIGRAAFRASLDRSDILVVAINHTAPSLEYLLHAIKYDSTHGTCRHADELSIRDGSLFYREHKIALFSQRDPSLIDWGSVGADYIIESTGKMLTIESASQHIKSGAKKVVISAPSKDAKTIVVGVNRKEYTSDMNIISNASCTTNCLAPLAKVIHKEFGIETGMMTTVHASTSSQGILDGFSKKSRRLGRGVGSNIIPTTTGAAKAVQLVLPELAGKFTGISIRVPVNNVSMVDLTVSLTRPAATKEELLEPLRKASTHPRLGNVLCVNDDELVSSDFLGFNQSCIVDSAATVLLNPHTAKIIAWYDNEWGYSVRILDLLVHMFEVDTGISTFQPSS
ncbi:putative glyceraldehyde 3-phosphate dehydrogenase [Meredithblackwellia eburnea MCA 4105]